MQVDLDTSTRPLLVTPNRFTRMTQIAFWNTGNGSPDAVAFAVDRPGIVLAGVCVYGGSGNYEYEVELLVEVCGEVSPSRNWIDWGCEKSGGRGGVSALSCFQVSTELKEYLLDGVLFM